MTEAQEQQVEKAGAAPAYQEGAAGSEDPHTGPIPPSGAVKPSGIARLQQNLNLAGVGLFFSLLGGNRSLAIPHLSVQDIRSVNWAALSQAGLKGVVFDKDNTLSEPFAMQIEPKLVESLHRCKQAFGSQGMALYSNSAGLKQYDPQGHEAAALEAALGVAVLRHSEKKPAGGREEVERHFGCQSHELVFVGDRYLTDIVFGNRHGMLTVRPAPLTDKGEPLGVVVARRTEDYFVARWTGKGVQPLPHPLVPDAKYSQFVLDPAQ